ncbi:hypothetical protein C0995_012925 [Termitomyces sp. Mi166|nr:hypothetical protein C0995_012925 [Termitomyces sp. Mi166\
MVFQALQNDLAAQVQFSLTEFWAALDAVLVCITQLKLMVDSSGWRGPKVNPPEVYDGISKPLVDQYVHQVLAAAKFENFQNEEQKIVWAQSYLSVNWFYVIMEGPGDSENNPCHFQWEAWLRDFKALYCTWELEQDALAWLGQLQQGSKSIIDYCKTFFELQKKLKEADAASEWVKDQFWKGLNAAAVKALMNMDDKMSEEESKLADIAAKEKSGWHTGNSFATRALSAPSASSSAVQPQVLTHLAPSPAPADPNAMDVDQANHAPAQSTGQKCFKCLKPGHLIVDCPLWMASIKTVAQEAMGAGEKKEGKVPKAGFV